MPLSPDQALIAFLVASVLIGLAFHWYLCASERIEEQRQANAHRTINADTLGALVDVVLSRRQRGSTTIYHDRDIVLREVDALLFQRGQFPGGSASDMSDHDYHRITMTILHTASDLHHADAVKTLLLRKFGF